MLSGLVSTSERSDIGSRNLTQKAALYLHSSTPKSAASMTMASALSTQALTRCDDGLERGVLGD